MTKKRMVLLPTTCGKRQVNLIREAMGDNLFRKHRKLVMVGLIVLVVAIVAGLLVWQQYLSNLIVPFWSGK